MRGPAQRHAIQSASATTSADGPSDATASSSSRRSVVSGATSSATTQPRTRRPCSGTRTIAPTCTSDASGSGTR